MNDSAQARSVVESKQDQKRIWLPLLVTVAAALVPFIPAVTAVIRRAHLADQLAVSALTVTVGGFAVTVWQLLRTANAATAASRAITKLRFKVAVVEESQLCRDCLGRASEIERLHFLAATQPSLPTFLLLPDLYRNLRLSLVELRTRRDKSWSDDEKQTVQDALAKLRDTERTVLRYVADHANKPIPRVIPLNTSMQSLSGLLTILSVQLNSVVLGDYDDQR
jgi:Zn finger protein HypA/HybF involved in hydrogenase expression